MHTVDAQNLKSDEFVLMVERSVFEASHHDAIVTSGDFNAWAEDRRIRKAPHSFFHFRYHRRVLPLADASLLPSWAIHPLPRCLEPRDLTLRAERIRSFKAFPCQFQLSM